MFGVRKSAASPPKCGKSALRILSAWLREQVPLNVRYWIFVFHSTLDVRCSMIDVHLYNVTCERLQNILALMRPDSVHRPLRPQPLITFYAALRHFWQDLLRTSCYLWLKGLSEFGVFLLIPDVGQGFVLYVAKGDSSYRKRLTFEDITRGITVTGFAGFT